MKGIVVMGMVVLVAAIVSIGVFGIGRGKWAVGPGGVSHAWPADVPTVLSIGELSW